MIKVSAFRLKDFHNALLLNFLLLGCEDFLVQQYIANATFTCLMSLYRHMLYNTQTNWFKIDLHFTYLGTLTQGKVE